MSSEIDLRILSLRWSRFAALSASLLLCLLLAACATPAPRDAAAAPTRQVVLLSIDGLPADFPGSGAMPTLDALAAEGVRAQWMTPSYPTLTFPNHYTLVTGLRPDRHGIVHNMMLDPALGRFVSKEESARDGRWWGGEPIWATLQRQGGLAAVMFWPGSEAEIGGRRPAHYRRFERTVTPQARVDQLLAWLDLPAERRPRLLLSYFEHYDVAAHEHGMRSPQAMAELRTIDAALARLRAGLRARGLDAGTDLIVVSDHGMHDVTRERVRYLDDRLDPRPPQGGPARYAVSWWGEVAGVHPAPGHVAEVEAAFLGRHDRYACRRKSELPSAWRYGTHPRIPPILCQVDAGWRLQPRAAPPQVEPVRGQHGFASDDPSMRAVFVATGPSFRSGAVVPAFDNVDLYPLLARLLRIAPAANDGDPASTAAALR